MKILATILIIFSLTACSSAPHTSPEEGGRLAVGQITYKTRGSVGPEDGLMKSQGNGGIEVHYKVNGQNRVTRSLADGLFHFPVPDGAEVVLHKFLMKRTGNAIIQTFYYTVDADIPDTRAKVVALGDFDWTINRDDWDLAFHPDKELDNKQRFEKHFPDSSWLQQDWQVVWY